MSFFDATAAVLLIPIVTAAVLAALPGYRATARLNVLAALASFVCALSLFFVRPPPGPYLLVDDLNNVFIVLTTFVGFTTSVFSASYIGHEIEIGRLTSAHLRFYHAMYQVLMFAMNLALLANNIGVMWVAIELATLTTVMMVGIYRTHEALEAAWKYFILGSVGCCSATAPRSAWRRCTPGCRTRTRRARPRSRRCCRASSSTSRSMRCCASRCCSRSTRQRWRPVP
jgi:hydrogenase-4 component F